MASIARSGAGPSGAPLRLLYGGKGARAVVEIAGWLYPGGARVSVPTVADPNWRGPDGRARSIGELIAGQGDGTRQLLLAVHAEAIAEIVRAAGAAKAATPPGIVAAPVAAASRLLHQLVGQGQLR